MKILGIIAEYNPFHNGHEYQIKKAKEMSGADYIIAIMSGNYVQRGAPAIFDKSIRAEMALNAGIDAVFEIPALFSGARANDFAGFGISLLKILGVDFISFGAENDNYKLLDTVAKVLTDKEQELAVKKHISDDPFTDQVYTADQIKDVLPKADITIAALPSTPETNEFFGKKEFSLMKKTSFFINIARASVVNENALVEALSEHRIAGAALDVFEKEPLPENHPFWSMENVIISPHSASFTPDSWNRVLELLKNNFIAFSKGEKLTNEINKTKGY